MTGASLRRLKSHLDEAALIAVLVLLILHFL